jgi:hypothetical protein
MCVLAGISIVAATAAAIPTTDGAQISIDRALNSPTLTIHYTGANTALVELRLNGESIGTRSVNASKTSGDTNFDINLSELRDGDNQVEVRLYDRTGKLVGSDKTNISTEQSDRGPVFLKVPKMGETVQGPVDIKLGFGREMKDVYVSFFVDNNFKKMTNYPPFEFSWDTTIETNGWHEIEAWAIDGSSTTYKTRKTRVFVNNPGGRTDRVGVDIDIAPKTNPYDVQVTGRQAGFRSISGGSTQIAGATAGSLAPKLAPLTAGNGMHLVIGQMSGTKPALATSVFATGPKSLAPTGLHAAGAAIRQTDRMSSHHPSRQGIVAIRTPASTAQTLGGTQLLDTAVASATTLVRITRGSRLADIGTFAIVMNHEFVNFDVLPRVENGIPMTPFRYLFEKAGGNVDWNNLTKTVNAKGEGKDVWIQIGDRGAKVNSLKVEMESTPYIERGRTIVPLSFIKDALNVDVEYDRETGHVLISTVDK